MIDQKSVTIEKNLNVPPSGKKFKVFLMWGSIAKAYHVLHITDTVYYRPGMWLPEETVKAICAHPDWSVDAISDTLWQNLANFVGGKIPGISIPTTI